MNPITLDISALSVAMIPVVVGLSAIARGLNLPERFSPLTDIIFGIGLVTLVGGTVWQGDIVQGIIIGLSAAGLYNGSKVVTGTMKASQPEVLG